jgi:hypothetical protein
VSPLTGPSVPHARAGDFGHHPEAEAPMLESLAPDLWTATGPFSAGGMELGVRTTVARLPDDGLWVHSPIELTDALKADVDALGPVRFLVAPNKIHHLYLDKWVAAYPEARLHGVVGLPDKRKDLKWDGILLDGKPDPAWGGVFEQKHFLGAPHTNEMVFLHVPSRTLILTDLAFNIHEAHLMTRLYLRIGNCYGRLKTTAIMRFFVRDKQAARASVDRLLEWDFDRIVVSHGDVLEHGGPAALREAFEWL